MRQYKWLPLFSTQFLGVMNDNLLKHLIVFISVAWVAKEDNEQVISAAAAMLVIPYILFSPLAGRFAQVWAKQKVLEWAKLAEIPIMLLAIAAFYLNSLPLSITAMFFMGLQSALYSPAKYGLIRDIGGLSEVSKASGTMELLTFVGVLVGTLVAGLISDLPYYQFQLLAVSLLALAIAGYATSTKIKVTEDEPDQLELETLWPLKFVWQSFIFSKRIPGLNYTVLGLGFFWLVASLIQLNVIIHLQDEAIYGLSNTNISLVTAGIAISMGMGCWVAGVLSKNQAELALVPLGGIGLGLGSTIMALWPMSLLFFVIVLFATAFFAGFFKIPLNAWMQERVPGRQLGKILAYNNNVVFLFLLLSAAVLAAVGAIGNSYDVFKVVACCAWAITTVLYLAMPEMRQRLKSTFNYIGKIRF